MKENLKKLLKRILKRFGKRLSNYHAPAKPYEDGVVFLKGLMNKPAWVIDIGVADGTKELTDPFPMSEYKYLLVDANPKFLPYMEEMKKKYIENVEFENCFCGEKEEIIPFHLNKTGHNSSRYSIRGNTETIEVEVKRLDTIVSQHQVTGTILMKIDVEGAEIEVLKGATETLKMCDVVILETWINEESADTGRDFASIVGFMKENSFVVFDFFAGHNFKSGVLQHIDTVFVKANSSYRLIR
jgi:FkbM family methyltransferase